MKKRILKELEDLTIKEYQEMVKILEEPDSIGRDLRVLEYFVVPKSSVMNMDFTEVNLLITYINDKLGKDMRKYDDKWTKFKFKGIKYKLDKSFGQLKMGEFIDLVHFSKGDPIENLHIICAIIFKPYGLRSKFKKKKETLELAEEFKDLPIKVAYSAGFFLSNLKVNYLEKIQESLALN